MKKKNPKPMAYSKKNRSRGLKGRSLYISLIIVAIAAVGLVYGYRALTRPPETETAAEAFTPESKPASSAADTTAKQEAQPEQEKATPVHAAVQTNSSVKATVSPAKPSAKSRIETPVSPASVEDARILIEDLKQIPPEDTGNLGRALQALARQGDAAVPAIQEFIEAAENGDFAEESSENPKDYGSLELALLDTLSQIGGEEAIDIMVQRLQTTTEPEEIALLAKGVETNAPGEYREEILTAARNVMEMASEDQSQVGNNIFAMAQVFAAYGDESVVDDVEALYPRWKNFSMMVLAELPEGAGVPSLTRIVEDYEAASSDKNYAWRMLAQASRESPEASKIIVDAAYTNQITNNDFIRIAATLGGKEYRLLDPQQFARIAAKGTKSGNLPVTHLNLSAPRKWSDAEINQRLDLIDQLIETKPEPAIVDALQDAQASLLEWGDTPYIDGVRKR